MHQPVRGTLGDALGQLFDEPTSALDPGSRTEVNEVIRELAQAGLTMVVVPHDLQFAGRISDNIVFMDKQGHSGVRAAGPDSVQPAESPVQRSL